MVDLQNLTKKYNLELFFLCILAISLSVFFIRSPGTIDVSYWLSRMDNFRDYGLIIGFQRDGADYPPISNLILAVVETASSLLKIDRFIMLKISLLIFLLTSALIFYIFTRDILISLLLHLSLILSSVGFGYLDIYFAPFLLLSLFFLYSKKYLLFSLFFSLSCLIKYQPVIIAPFILLYILNSELMAGQRKNTIKDIFLKIFLPPVIIALSLHLIFGRAFILSFGRALSHFDLSAQALNLNWILQYFLKSILKINDEFINIHTYKYLIFPRYIFFILYTVIFIYSFSVKKKFEDMLRYCLLGYFTYFMFNTGLQENHLFITCILAAFLAYINKNYIYSFIIWSMMSNINLFVFYGISGSLPFSRLIFGIDLSIFIAFLYFIFYIYLFFNILPQY